MAHTIIKAARKSAIWLALLLSFSISNLLQPCPMFSQASAAAADNTASTEGGGQVFNQLEMLVRQYYPQAQIAKTGKTMHFEFNAKNEGGNASTPGLITPQDGGIVCDLSVQAGEYAGSDMDRIPGETGDGIHTTLKMAPYSRASNTHLLTLLTFPANASDEFKARFKDFVNGFALQVPAPAAALNTPAVSTETGKAQTAVNKPAQAASKPGSSGGPATQQIFPGEADGWHWVGGCVGAAQTFTANGSVVTGLSLRVAQLNEVKPTGSLRVEIRDTTLSKIYALGYIDPAFVLRDFYWLPVQLKYVYPLQPGKIYALVFTANDSRGDGTWLVNAIYQDIYPYGRPANAPDEEFFFNMNFDNGSSILVGPKGNNSKKRKPVNSGAASGLNPLVQGLEVQGFGQLPDAEYVTAKKPVQKKKAH